MLAPDKAKRIFVFCLDATFYNGAFGSGINLSSDYAKNTKHDARLSNVFSDSCFL